HLRYVPTFALPASHLTTQRFPGRRGRFVRHPKNHVENPRLQLAPSQSSVWCSQVLVSCLVLAPEISRLDLVRRERPPASDWPTRCESRRLARRIVRFRATSHAIS